MEDVSKDAELTEEDLRALESPAVTPKCAGPGNPAFGTAGADAFPTLTGPLCGWCAHRAECPSMNSGQGAGGHAGRASQSAGESC